MNDEVPITILDENSYEHPDLQKEIETSIREARAQADFDTQSLVRIFLRQGASLIDFVKASQEPPLSADERGPSAAEVAERLEGEIEALESSTPGISHEEAITTVIDGYINSTPEY